MSSSSSADHAPAIASSSRTSPTSNHHHDGSGRASEDGLELRDDELFAQEDPLDGSLNDPLTFKRTPTKPSLTSRFLSSPFGQQQDGRRSASPNPIRRAATPNTILSYLNTAADDAQDVKDPGGLDWYVEGPGKRVGYDNLTAIDWIYEYTKERTRLRQLGADAPGVLGQIRLLADASQIWIILVLTGIAVGGIAAGIDVAGDWLGDLKQGVCSNVQDGGTFYLNRAFCCWETTTYAQCPDWRSWGGVMGIHSKGGGYVVEYIFFVVCSVRGATSVATRQSTYTDALHRSFSRPPHLFWSTSTPSTLSNPAFRSSRLS